MSRTSGPRYWDPSDREFADAENPECPICGKPGEHECWTPEPKPDHVLVCQACEGLGYLTLYGTPYGAGFGVVAEAIPCACRYPKAVRDHLEPVEYTRRRIIQHARKYLSARDLDYPAAPVRKPEEDE